MQLNALADLDAADPETPSHATTDRAQLFVELSFTMMAGQFSCPQEVRYLSFPKSKRIIRLLQPILDRKVPVHPQAPIGVVCRDGAMFSPNASWAGRPIGKDCHFFAVNRGDSQFELTTNWFNQCLPERSLFD